MFVRGQNSKSWPFEFTHNFRHDNIISILSHTLIAGHKNILWKFRISRSNVKVTRDHWSVFYSVCRIEVTKLGMDTFITPYLNTHLKIKVVAIWNTDFYDHQDHQGHSNVVVIFFSETIGEIKILCSINTQSKWTKCLVYVICISSTLVQAAWAK